MASKKKWGTKAFASANGGSLTKLGWPDGAKLVVAARKDRAGVVRKLLLLANASSDPGTQAKAKTIIAKIKRELGES